MEYKTYLFDFDYTLANSEAGIVMCFQKLLANHDYPPQNNFSIKKTIGLFMPEAITILTGEKDTKFVKKLQEEYSLYADEYMTENTYLYPETIPLLRKLKAAHYNLGIISNKTKHRILETLANENITSLIDIIIGTENAKQPKPSATPLLQALAFLQADPKSAMYIGDSLTDAQTAQNASVDFTAVLTGQTSYEEFIKHPHVKIVHTLAQIY
ncbi:HAD family hydrolase [Pectinatus sottacetonis]|uniref:HAD family hydrolase n=1 Tax=Pectinatus sottacetonis TaxID=1002795 RepID=UPI0018C4FB0B|nr:HAD family hydrolase [Pectinatus sottacetonis]